MTYKIHEWASEFNIDLRNLSNEDKQMIGVIMESEFPIRSQLGDRILWSLNGMLHRTDGPAMIMNNGNVYYFVNSMKHRLDGPAVVYNNGIKEWWVNGFLIDGKIHEWASEFNIDLDNLSNEDRQMIVLYWGNYGN